MSVTFITFFCPFFLPFNYTHYVQIYEFSVFWLGMAIFARPMSTRPDPILMGRILLNRIRNRVGYGLKKKPEMSPGRV